MIKYSSHATEQMTKRAITEGEVEQILDDPDDTYLGDREGRECFVKKIGERVLEAVIVWQRSGDPLVITVFNQLDDI